MMTKKAKRSKNWSYSVGERGKNRVRAFEQDGRLFVEYYDDLPGSIRPKRRRLAIPSTDREVAKAKAEELAMAFRREERLHDGRLTLGKLFEMYEREVTPRKGRSKQRHDRVTFGLFRDVLGAGRDVRTLNRRDIDRYSQARLSGEVAPQRPIAKKWRKSTKPLNERVRTVRRRTIQYELKTLMAALNWAITVRDDRGAVLLDRNPLKGLPFPSESSPRRAVFSDEQFDGLCTAAPTIHPLFDLAVTVAYYTGHRISAILHLRWSDIDLGKDRITWRAAHDKRRREHVTPLSTHLKAVLQAERRNRLAIGDGWVFPNPKGVEAPVPSHMAGDWMTRGLKAIGITQGSQFGYHSIRRHFATAFKHLPLVDLCALGGWQDPSTVLTCYMQPDEVTMREAIEQRRPVRAVAQ